MLVYTHYTYNFILPIAYCLLVAAHVLPEGDEELIKQPQPWGLELSARLGGDTFGWHWGHRNKLDKSLEHWTRP